MRRERKPAPSVVAEVSVTGMAAGGDGVARHGDLVVFIPRSAPGDRVEIAMTQRRRYAQGRIRRILAPSPDRVEPACLHYVRDRCGGCQLQHLRIEAQRTAKATIVRDSMTRIGKRAIDPPDVRPSPDAWRYRNKLTMALRRRGSGWIAGLHPYDRPGEVFAVTDCPITNSRVLDVWRAVIDAASCLPDGAHRGAVRWTDPAASFVLEGGTAWPRAEEFFAAVPVLGALWWIPDGAPRRLMAARGAAASPAFGQVNPAMAAELREHVLALIEGHGAKRVVDAYAGEGDLAAELERRGVSVRAIELDAEASARMRTRLGSTTVIEGRVEDVLSGTLPADLIVLNPPRAGLHETVPQILDRTDGVVPSDRSTLVYVSCDPATLARDVARLPSYRVASVVAFDMFPQTAHVETVCELVPA